MGVGWKLPQFNVGEIKCGSMEKASAKNTSRNKMRVSGAMEACSSAKPLSPTPAAQSIRAARVPLSTPSPVMSAPVAQISEGKRIATPPTNGVSLACRLRRLSGRSIMRRRFPIVSAFRQMSKVDTAATTPRKIESIAPYLLSRRPESTAISHGVGARDLQTSKTLRSPYLDRPSPHEKHTRSDRHEWRALPQREPPLRPPWRWSSSSSEELRGYRCRYCY